MQPSSSGRPIRSPEQRLRPQRSRTDCPILLSPAPFWRAPMKTISTPLAILPTIQHRQHGLRMPHPYTTRIGRFRATRKSRHDWQSASTRSRKRTMAHSSAVVSSHAEKKTVSSLLARRALLEPGCMRPRRHRPLTDMAFRTATSTRSMRAAVMNMRSRGSSRSALPVPGFRHGRQPGARRHGPGAEWVQARPQRPGSR